MSSLDGLEPFVVCSADFYDFEGDGFALSITIKPQDEMRGLLGQRLQVIGQCQLVLWHLLYYNGALILNI